MLLDKPTGFEVEGRHFCIYPSTIGKAHIISRLIEMIGIDLSMVKVNAFLEVARILHTKPEECYRIIAISTLKTKDEICDEPVVRERINYLASNLEGNEAVTLLILILTESTAETFIKETGLQTDKDRERRVSSVKESKNVYTFGGKTVYGTMIDFFCERYGWTFDYVVWGISLNNLKMLMADHIRTINLTDDERKRVKISNDREIIKADSKDAMKEILSMEWD